MEKILLAADNRLLRQIMAMVLREECDALDTASSPNELEKLSLTGGYNLIVTSFTEPLVNGTDLANRLHRRRVPASLFLITSEHREEQIVELLASGVDQIFSVPIDTVRLKRKVREELNRLSKQ
ncbi:MAG: response regulator [Tidjanibacter sp.]|nr:response regulator [Tidjanibacter sp.]